MTRSLSLLCLVLVATLGCGPAESDPPADAPDPEASSGVQVPAGEAAGSTDLETADTGAASAAGAEHAYVTVTDSDFQQVVLESEQPVLVDIWAPWCGPCLQIAPVIEELAVEYEGRAVVAKLDVDANPQVPSKYEVTGIPTLLFFNNGQVAERLVGAQYSKEDLAAQLDAMLAGS